MKQVLKWCGGIYTITGFDFVPNGDQGMVWQFYSSENQTLVVVPFQDVKPTTAPEWILPTLAGRRGLGDLGFLVAKITGPNFSTCGTAYALRIVKKFVRWCGEENPSLDEVVKPLYNALLRLRGKRIYPENYDAILDQLETLTKGKIQAQAVKEKLFMGFSTDMPRYIEQLAKEEAEARGCSDIAARQFVFGSCPYCGEYSSSGTVRLLRSVQCVPASDPLLKSLRPREIPGAQKKYSETLELLAKTQKTLSSGILVDGDGTRDMSEEDKLFFNLLRQKNQSREGWALSYREIGSQLKISPTEIGRKRRDLEARFPKFTGIISEARQKNDKGTVHPDLCTSGRRVLTKDRPEHLSESD